MTSPLVERLMRAGFLDRLFIDGEWVAPSGAARASLIDPSTEEAFAPVALGTARDVAAAVAAARRAFASWSVTPARDRADLLDRVHRLILERAEWFAQAISLEMGAAITMARNAQVPFAAEHIRVARDLAASHDFVSHRGDMAILREPIGVCALITPWNWPLYQITAKVGPALAAGCTVVLKPSELSPLSGLLFAALMRDAGVPAGVFNLVNGDGPEVGAAMAAHPDVDMISITGSTRAGVLVAQAAAVTVKRVAQELGGKSPNVLLPDADFARAVPAGVAAAFRNVGQSCSAPTRMIVPRGRLAEVERLARDAVSGIVVGDPRSPDTTHGPVANRAQFDRVQQMIDVGIAEGARLVCGGPGRPEGLERGFYVRPTVFSDVHPRMRIAQEEIFGPVLCIIAYDSVDQAVEIANDTVYGLGAHVQGKDLAAARAVAARIRAGQVHINHPAWNPMAPFGGYKRSGNGREYGVEGLHEFLETKAVLGYGHESTQPERNTIMNAALMLHRADGADESTPFRKAAFGTADPFGRCREIAWEGPDSMCAGRVNFIGELEVAGFPHTETVVVMDGELTLAAPGAEPLVLRRGEGAVIARGTALRILAGARVLFVSCAAAAEGPGNPGLKRLRPDAEAHYKPTNPPPVEALLGPVPQCRSDRLFIDEQAQYQAGTWDSTPYHRTVRPHRLNELMVLLAGSVRFGSPDGSVLSACTGDAIFVPQGAPIGWESSERVAKFYVVQELRA